MSTPRAYSSEHRRRQAEETRLAIRRAARLLFVASGLAATTVEAIAKKAGVSPATVYATYGSKPAIIVAIIDEMEVESGLREEIPLLLQSRPPASARPVRLGPRPCPRGGVGPCCGSRWSPGASRRCEPSSKRGRQPPARHRGAGGGLGRAGRPTEAAGRWAVEADGALTSVEWFVLLAVDRLGWEAQALFGRSLVGCSPGRSWGLTHRTSPVGPCLVLESGPDSSCRTRFARPSVA